MLSGFNLESMNTIISIISGIIGLAASIWSGLKVYKKCVVPLVKHVKQVFTLADKIQAMNSLQKEQQDKLKEKIEKIYYQMSPNSGKSIKDVITKLSSDMQKVNQRLTSQQQRRKIKDFNSSYPIFQINKKGDCTWSNKIMQIWTGRSQQQLSGKGWVLTIHQDERQYVQKQWQHAIDQQRQIQLDYNVYNPTTNQKKHVFCRGHLIKDGKGNLKNYIVVLTQNNDQLLNDISGQFNSIDLK